MTAANDSQGRMIFDLAKALAPFAAVGRALDRPDVGIVPDDGFVGVVTLDGTEVARVTMLDLRFAAMIVERHGCDRAVH